MTWAFLRKSRLKSGTFFEWETAHANAVKHFSGKPSERGKRRIHKKTSPAPFTIATAPPSSFLRAPDGESRRQQMRAFVDDLKPVVVLLTETQEK